MPDKPTLLSLPVEIKLQIYSYLVHDPSPIEFPLSEPLCSQASFILTCRQLRYELQHEFFSKNVFAIGFESDEQVSSTKHPSLEEINALSREYKRFETLRRVDFEFKYDSIVLESYGKQGFVNLRPLDSSVDLTQIEDLQLHIFHRRFYKIHPTALDEMLSSISLPKWLPSYVSECKEELKVVLDALARAKSMKGRLGLKKLTVVDHMPCESIATLHENTKKELKRLLADMYWPVLAQAAATLGIGIENVKIRLNYVSAFDWFAIYQPQ